MSENPFTFPQLSERATLSIVASLEIGMLPEYVLAVNLIEDFKAHYESVKQHYHGMLSESDFEEFKIGFLAPLIIIRISAEEERTPGVRGILLRAIQHAWGYAQSFSEFIESETDNCTAERRNHPVDWLEIYDRCRVRASELYSTKLYVVGNKTSEEVFVTLIRNMHLFTR
jgi:hypothetical protein